MHNQLLISITLALGLLLQPLRPRLLANGLPGPRLGLVERGDAVEVDMLVERVLERGRNVIGVIMGAVVMA